MDPLIAQMRDELQKKREKKKRNLIGKSQNEAVKPGHKYFRNLVPYFIKNMEFLS